MPDRTFLQWPFFESAHTPFYDGVCAFADRSCEPQEGAVDGVVRRYVSSMASAGLLDALESLDVRRICLTREALAYRDALADFAFAMQGLGSAPITLFGTAEQRERFAKPVTGGAAIGAFALTEREAGSDVAATASTARREGGEYVINGEKTWISNAGLADTYVLFARTSGEGARGLSAFVLAANTAGLTARGGIETISPHPLGTLTLQDVRVPADCRIGQEGDGFKIAMATLDIFRASVGAAALGFARRAFDESVAHAKSRSLFGEPLAAMQLTQAALADMATRIDASALLVYRAAWAKDGGAARVTREAAMAKWYATESAQIVADRAVQLFGGRGVTRGEAVERIYRDVRALRIYEGASEVQQVVIARAVLS